MDNEDNPDSPTELEVVVMPKMSNPKSLFGRISSEINAQ